MTATTPESLIDALIRARNAGDVEAARGCYEDRATIVAQPGDVRTGVEGVQDVLEFFVSLHPVFDVSTRLILTTGDLALHLSRWTLRGVDAAGAAVELSGESADVLRRQLDGTWLLTIDNPWGSALLAE